MKICDVVKMADKMIVDEIGGKIESVYKRSTGKHEQYGDWSLQNILISDDTGKIVIKIGNKPPFSETDKGKEIILKSVKSDKGWNGVKVEDYADKDGQIKKQLSVTKSAVVSIPQKQTENGSSVPQNEPVKETKLTNNNSYNNMASQKAMLTSYAKDLCIAGKLEFDKIIDWVNEQYDNIIKNVVVDVKKEITNLILKFDLNNMPEKWQEKPREELEKLYKDIVTDQTNYKIEFSETETEERNDQ